MPAGMRRGLRLLQRAACSSGSSVGGKGLSGTAAGSIPAELLSSAAAGAEEVARNEPDRTNPMAEELPYISGSQLRAPVHPAGGGDVLESPLSEEELQRHRNAEHDWMDFAKRLAAARAEGDAAATLAVLDEGVALSQRHGKDLRRPGYDAQLHLEAAALHEAAGRLAEAEDRTRLAVAEYAADFDAPGERRAAVQRGVLLLKLNQFAEAEELYAAVLSWCENDAKKGTPMAQGAAQTLAPLCKLGLAKACIGLERFDEAHSFVGDILPSFADTNKVGETWECLLAAEAIFRGKGNAASVKKALERQLAWAKRHKLDAEVPLVEAKLADLAAAQ